MTTYYHLLLPCRAFFFFFFFFCSIVRCAARRQLAAGGRLSRRSVRTTDHDKRQAAALKLRTLCCGSPARTLLRTTACPESPSGQVVQARGPDLRPGRAPCGPDLRSGGPSARNAVPDLTVRFFPDLAVRKKRIFMPLSFSVLSSCHSPTTTAAGACISLPVPVRNSE